MAVIIAFDTEDPSIPHLYVAGKDRQTIFGLTNDGKQFAHLKLGASVELTLDQARQIGEPYLDEVLSNI